MFIAALFTIAKNQEKKIKCPVIGMDKQMVVKQQKRMNHCYTKHG